MKYVDEYREPQKGEILLREIESLSKILNKRMKMMEVCGGHTHFWF